MMERVSREVISPFSHYSAICMHKLSINILSFCNTVDGF